MSTIVVVAGDARAKEVLELLREDGVRFFGQSVLKK